MNPNGSRPSRIRFTDGNRRSPAGPWLIALCGLLVVAQPGQAETADGGAAGQWLSHYTGARTLGLGGAFVASADEPLGVIWNPAAERWEAAWRIVPPELCLKNRPRPGTEPIPVQIG